MFIVRPSVRLFVKLIVKLIVDKTNLRYKTVLKTQITYAVFVGDVDNR